MEFLDKLCQVEAKREADKLDAFNEGANLMSMQFDFIEELIVASYKEKQ